MLEPRDPGYDQEGIWAKILNIHKLNPFMYHDDVCNQGTLV